MAYPSRARLMRAPSSIRLSENLGSLCCRGDGIRFHGQRGRKGVKTEALQIRQCWQPSYGTTQGPVVGLADSRENSRE